MEDTEKKIIGIDESFVTDNAQKITDEDVRKVTENAEKIEKKFLKNGPLKRFIEDVKLMIALVRDYWTGVYRKVPFRVIAAVCFALLYVLNSLDLIPDMIPVVGLLDDIAVIWICLHLVESEINKYRQWKSDRSERPLPTEGEFEEPYP